jgi:hypothetical protein
MMIQLSLAVLVLAFAVILTVRTERESVVSLLFGTLVTLGFGVSELWMALQAPQGAPYEQGLSIATSIALTSSSALFARLLIQSVRLNRRESATSRI